MLKINRFPWESAFTGAEVTPDICPLCRENQQHITGDIAWAARSLVALTKDQTWLQSGGNDFIHEMAAFWESRPTPGQEANVWEINGNWHHMASIFASKKTGLTRRLLWTMHFVYWILVECSDCLNLTN